jgi:hypothetical protein
MYPDFISRRPGVLHLQLLNAEHMWARDAALHRQMNAFLVRAPAAFCFLSGRPVQKAHGHACS